LKLQRIADFVLMARSQSRAGPACETLVRPGGARGEAMTKKTKGPFTDAKRNRQWNKLDNMARCIEAGQCDHMFADAETKQYMLADIMRELEELVRAEMRSFPGLYRELPDGSWALAKPNVLSFPHRRP
jgi:hypothetical protein